MSRIVEVKRIDGKTSYIAISHIRAIHDLSNNCYSVVYGESDDSFIQVDEDNFKIIMLSMEVVTRA